MTFIDNSAKTNWKFVGIVAILAVVIGAVALFAVLNTQSTQTSIIPSEDAEELKKNTNLQEEVVPNVEIESNGTIPEEQVSQDETSEVLPSIYTPEEVLRLGAELNGKVIEVRGVLVLIPFRDSFGLGGAGPGFVTDDGNISMNAPAAIASISQNIEIIVRGVYDSEGSYLQLPPGCGITIPSSDCVEIVAESTP